MEKYYKQLADNLRIERAKRKLSQQKLAILANISIETVGAIEREIANPTLDTLISIALALDVDLNTLLKLKK